MSCCIWHLDVFGNPFQMIPGDNILSSISHSSVRVVREEKTAQRGDKRYEKIRVKFLPCPPKDGGKPTKGAALIGNRMMDWNKDNNNNKHGVCWGVSHALYTIYYSTVITTTTL